MAREQSSTSSNNTEANIGRTFEVNRYSFYYKTRNHMLDTGFRLMETVSNNENESTLIENFRRMLIQYGLDGNIFLTIKLTPLSRNRTFYSKNFEKRLSSLHMRFLQMFLIHYPAPPNSQARCSKNKALRIESWIAVSQLRDQTKINAIGVSNFTINHLIQLTEVIAISPMVYKMRWYSLYTYSCGGFSQSSSVLMENPGIKRLAVFYGVPAAQILMLWILQRGGVVVPNLFDSYFAMNDVQLDIRLTRADLALLEAFHSYTNNPIVF